MPNEFLPFKVAGQLGKIYWKRYAVFFALAPSVTIIASKSLKFSKRSKAAAFSVIEALIPSSASLRNLLGFLVVYNNEIKEGDELLGVMGSLLLFFPFFPN